MRNAQSIIAEAMQIAKVGNLVNGTMTGYTTQALDELNSLLDHITKTIDFSAARGDYYFTFNPDLVVLGNGNIVQASANPLPVDYLRVQTSGGSSGAQRSTKWYLDGVPYDLIEVDLTEWDDQVQQPGIQSYPYYAAKNIATRQILAYPTGDLSVSSQTVANLSSLTGIQVGMGIAGGIGPQSVVSPGTTVTALGSNSLTLSAAPLATMTGASLIIGNVAQLLIYPPPSGAFNALIRYQRVMPPLTAAQVTGGAYCWFDDDMVLVDGLVGLLMRYSGDQRMREYIGDGLGAKDMGLFGKHMAQYIKLADDRANRSDRVELDRRYFGKRFATLPNTKQVGW